MPPQDVPLHVLTSESGNCMVPVGIPTLHALVESTRNTPLRQQQRRVIRGVFAPLFDGLLKHIPCYRVWVDPQDEATLAVRLLTFLWGTRGFQWTRGASSRTVAPGWRSCCDAMATLVFFWTYIDVDMDLDRWQERYPMLPVCEHLLRRVVRGTRATMTIDVGELSYRQTHSLYRAMRLASLESHVPGARCVLWQPTERGEMDTVCALRRSHMRARWLVTCCLTVSGMAFASESVAQFYVGDWWDVLEVSECGTHVAQPSSRRLGTRCL